MKIIEGNFGCNVNGFKFAGISAGFKKSGKKDLSLIYSESKGVSAATFTQNKAKAAPVILNMDYIKNNNTQAIIVNSGQANACTGKVGMNDSIKIAELVSKELSLKPEEVLQASTGVIGVPIPMNIMEEGIKTIVPQLKEDSGYDASEGILTTDTSTKVVNVDIEINGVKVGISGMCKGSGMIHPNMATMLGFVITDLNISKEMLNKALKDSVEDSYNMISVDGDTSTNDMVIVLANAVADNKKIEEDGEDFEVFKEALDYVNKELAKKIAEDGEGATKLIEVKVLGAYTIKDAKLIAKSVITSNLVKTAFFGSDPNWGRILCAAGYSEADFDPDKTDLFYKSDKGEIQVLKDGMNYPYDNEFATSLLKEKKVQAILDLKNGDCEATAWGCDLSYKYVEINGEYTT
ncbi:bifunctional glutamate N-acetyltransferase/amino-acid acetyltransferase ArgJ [Clostridium sp. DL1XJH146]